MLGELTNEEIINNGKDADMIELKKTDVRDVVHKEAVCASFISFKRLF